MNPIIVKCSISNVKQQQLDDERFQFQISNVNQNENKSSFQTVDDLSKEINKKYKENFKKDLPTDFTIYNEEGYLMDKSQDIEKAFDLKSNNTLNIFINTKSRKDNEKNLISNIQNIPDDELRVRQELAAAYRIFDLMGWTDTIYGHLTVRVPNKKNNEKQFLINPFGLLYSEITASSLIKLDLDGNVIDPGTTSFPHNDAGYVIHSALHGAQNRDPGCEIECVMHCHFSDGVAISCLDEGLIPQLSQTSQILGTISYHDYEGIAVDREEKARLQKDIGSKSKVMILRNHGLVTCGQNVGEAFLLMYYLVEACKIQIRALSAVGGDISRLSLPSEEIAQKTYRTANGFNSEGFGKRELVAYMRLLDKKDSSYRKAK